jgi:lipoprotein signal peptidase
MVRAVREVSLNTSATRKWVIFGTVFAVWLVADLWSKHWADTRLGTANHPLVVRVGPEDAGRPLGEVLTTRLGLDTAELPRVIAATDRLAPAVTLDGEARVFADQEALRRQTGFWLFWRDDLGLAPRRLDLRRDLNLIEGWLRLAHPETPREAISEAALGVQAEVAFAEWASQVYTRLDPEEVAALAGAGRLHPIAWADAALDPQGAVADGETYLVGARHIDVSGEWFKFVYAENPGAAFGLMKDLPPDTRHLVFVILTLVAFGVILSITWRLPAHSRLVLVAFAGILSGAVGNFVDRLRYRFVIDFIDMDLGFMHWPTYNVADIAISLGVVAILIDVTFNKASVLAAPPASPPASKDGAAAAGG